MYYHMVTATDLYLTVQSLLTTTNLYLTVLSPWWPLLTSTLQYYHSGEHYRPIYYHMVTATDLYLTVLSLLTTADLYLKVLSLWWPLLTSTLQYYYSGDHYRSLPYSTITLVTTTQDQDQDSLLVKRRNDNHSPGPVIRELVSSSHQRSELSHTILCIFSGWDQRIVEGIPIPDSLGEEATFINICIGNGSLKCHRVLIPTTPSFGDKVICWYTGFTFKTFI